MCSCDSPGSDWVFRLRFCFSLHIFHLQIEWLQIMKYSNKFSHHNKYWISFFFVTKTLKKHFKREHLHHPKYYSKCFSFIRLTFSRVTDFSGRIFGLQSTYWGISSWKRAPLEGSTSFTSGGAISLTVINWYALIHSPFDWLCDLTNWINCSSSRFGYSRECRIWSWPVSGGVLLRSTCWECVGIATGQALWMLWLGCLRISYWSFSSW